MPDHPVVALLNRQKRALIAREEAQQRDLARDWLAIERELDGDIDSLAQELQQRHRDGQAITFAVLLSQLRFQRLIARIQALTQPLQGTAVRSITDIQGLFAQAGFGSAAAVLTTLLRREVEPIPAALLADRIGLAANGEPIASVIGDVALPAIDGLTRDALTGAVERASLFAGLAAGLQHVLTVARTEEWNVYREAEGRQYQASGVVTGYKRVAELSSTTCAACLALHGTVTPTSDIPTHVNCRCTFLPLVDGVPEPTMQSGASWFLDQDAETQRAILGPGRYAAFQRGTPFADFARTRNHATWGPTLQLTPVRSL